MALERGLNNRHVQLISLGGAIGTGLFLASGQSIELAGPSILLVYLIVSVFILLIMRALGELLLSNLDCHSFLDLANEYLGERMAFITGWTYWFCWVSVAMADLTAIGIYMKYWFPDLAQWIPAFITLIFLMIFNLTSVKIFGEIEFWLALIKIIAIIALILTGLYLIFTQFESKSGIASFSNIYSHGGFFPKGLSGFILSFQLAVFSFAGVELVGLMAGETKDPQIVIPKAINNIPIRILLFYVGSLTIIMSITPWDVINASESPFVTVFSTAGIIGAASIINFVVLSSALSAANSALFSTSRMIYGLANNDHASEKFKTLSTRRTPSRALYFSTLIIGATVILNYVVPAGAFSIAAGIATITVIYTWVIIILCHIQYLKKNKERHHFKMPFAPYTDYLVLAFLAFILVLLGIIPGTRASLFVSPIWFLGLALIYQFKFKKTNV